MYLPMFVTLMHRTLILGNLS